MNWSPGRESKQGPPNHKAGLLTISFLGPGGAFVIVDEMEAAVLVRCGPQCSLRRSVLSSFQSDSICVVAARGTCCQLSGGLKFRSVCGLRTFCDLSKVCSSA